MSNSASCPHPASTWDYSDFPLHKKPIMLNYIPLLPLQIYECTDLANCWSPCGNVCVCEAGVTSSFILICSSSVLTWQIYSLKTVFYFIFTLTYLRIPKYGNHLASWHCSEIEWVEDLCFDPSLGMLWGMTSQWSRFILLSKCLEPSCWNWNLQLKSKRQKITPVAGLCSHMGKVIPRVTELRRKTWRLCGCKDLKAEVTISTYRPGELKLAWSQLCCPRLL